MTQLKLISKNDLEEVQLAMVAKRFEPFLRVRAIFAAIAIGLIGLTLVGDHAIWRWWMLGITVGTILARSIHEWLWPERTFDFLWGRSGSNTATPVVVVLLIGVIVLASGGFDSPMLPILIPLCFFFGTIRTTAVAAKAAVASMVLVAGLAAINRWRLIPDLLPAVFGGGPGIPQARTLLYAKAVGLVVALAWAALVSRVVRQVFRQMVADALDARDEVLTTHAAHAQELIALTGELAHELKNPLANLKGLAVLVGRDVQGAGVERLAVLQGEIGRMEATLQSFLTFSRPVSPLCLETVNLSALCASVLSLHEGIAHGKGIPLSLAAAESVPALCDRRKVKEIIINLLQNALEASPRGASVELSVARMPDGETTVEIRDFGGGISPDVRAHLFKPGTTTKEQGNGLGLAMARGLARQHGGDVSLENRQPTGCTARLFLPGRAEASALEVTP